MYTKEEAAGDLAGWFIIDPYGDVVVFIEHESAADVLLSHLNR